MIKNQTKKLKKQKSMGIIFQTMLIMILFGYSILQ